MARINSKSKGNTFEREVVKLFTEQFGEGFQRVPCSGAIFGKTNMKRSHGMSEECINTLTGDLITPESFPYSLEYKFHKDLEFHQLIQGKCKKMDDWLEQSSQDAVLSGKVPLVVFKLNNKGIYVCLDFESVRELNLDNYLKYKEKVIISLEIFFSVKKSINIIKEFIEGDSNG